VRRLLSSDVSDQPIPFALYIWSIWEEMYLLVFFCLERAMDRIRDACHFGRVFIVHP
jgi:hypothetical protein